MVISPRLDFECWPLLIFKLISDAHGEPALPISFKKKVRNGKVPKTLMYVVKGATRGVN